MHLPLLLVALACAGDRAPAASSVGTSPAAALPAAGPSTASATASPPPGPAGDPTVGATGPVGPTLPLTVGGRVVQVELADDPAEREHGLMYRDGLAADHGMIFVYPDERERGFWMRNTRIPLSIAYLDAQGRVVHLADMQPFDETPIRSWRPAMYALEMSQGWFAAHGVAVGAKVEGLPAPSRE